MKILMVSYSVNHFFNWALQLENSGHEVYWFDIGADYAYEEKINFVNQIVFWKRKIDYPGRYWMKKNLPVLNRIVESFNKNDFDKVLERKILEIKPDIVQSFEIHLSAIPILHIMKKHPDIKWIWSAWGNDIYAFKNQSLKIQEIKKTLKRIDYMFADCKRDYQLAANLGFKGKYLGTFPTGGGYDFDLYDSFIRDFRKTIIIKGYQHEYGRAINILKGLLEVRSDILSRFQIVVFGASKSVLNYVSEEKSFEKLNLTIFERTNREVVLDLMGQSIIYIGNSISDGMPNTVLEAIIMGVFPIQTNPGGATEEIIEHGKNGLLIQDPNDVLEIAHLIEYAIENLELLKKGIAYNLKYIKPRLERGFIQNQVLQKYKLIEGNL